MATRLLVRHQRLPYGERIEVLVFLVDQRRSVRLEDTREEAISHQRALPVASVGVESIADDRLTVANDVGDDGDDRTGHLRKIDVGIGDRRGDRDRLLANVDNAHGQVSSSGSDRVGDRLAAGDRIRLAAKISCTHRLIRQNGFDGIHDAFGG
jgi:hypothetical protein